MTSGASAKIPRGLFASTEVVYYYRTRFAIVSLKIAVRYGAMCLLRTYGERKQKLTTMMVVKETTGDKVKRLREDLSLSQRELASEAGVSPATILKIEKDEVENPHPSTVRKLAAALGVPPRDLRAD